ncbi:MAG: M17 family metallopeptidase [Pseudomonadales bacterium]
MTTASIRYLPAPAESLSQGSSAPAGAMDLTLVTESAFDHWRSALPAEQQEWVTASTFRGKPGQFLRLPGTTEFVAGSDGAESLATLGGLPMNLPEGSYCPTAAHSDLELLGWVLGSYTFTRYRKAKRLPAQLHINDAEQHERVLQEARAVWLARDLINLPAGDMLPSHMAAAARELAAAFDADCEITEGDALLDKGYRTIHAVGRAATDAPRLIDLHWGNPANPKVTLIGKGVCFDSGGLDIKPSAGMRTMKKDMGGAAQVFGLAMLIMSRNLPIRLRVLVPAVENAIAGNAYRPGDVIKTYEGQTVEIDNTDAEGRLVLCDALALAAEEQPELMIDYATLTGAARAAVGAEIAALFASDHELAQTIYHIGVEQDDAVWHMPLHAPYESMLNSKIADSVNSAASPYAGAITAALFLQKFTNGLPWIHFDLNAFNVRSRPGRPEGGEAMGLRAIYAYLAQRFG